MSDTQQLQQWMQAVLQHGWKGTAEGQAPFAAAIYTVDGEQLSLETNTVRSERKPSRHGEVNAIDAACHRLGLTKLSDVWLISSAEPCPMCTATAATAGISQIAFGASYDTVRKAGFQTLGLSCDALFEHISVRGSILGGILEADCDQFLLQNAKH